MTRIRIKIPVPTKGGDYKTRDEINTLVAKRLKSRKIPIPIQKVLEVRVQTKFDKKGPTDVDNAGKQVIDALCPQQTLGKRGSHQQSRTAILKGDTYKVVPRVVFEAYHGASLQPLHAYLHIKMP